MRAPFIVILVAGPAFAAPPAVPVVKPVEREVFDHADFAGRTEASTTVEIRARLGGAVEKVLFKEGSTVKKGDVLLVLDDRLQRTEVQKALAEHRRAEARFKAAELDYGRLVRLGEAKSVSQDEVARASALVDEARASLMATRAAQEAARINLDYMRIESPISGRIGRATATAGALVQGAEVLATVYAVDPLHVTFDLDERTLLRLVRHLRGKADEKVTIGLALTGDDGFSRTAVVDFLDPALDPKTGALRVRATLANPKDEVRPGQRATVRVPLSNPRKALLVPEQAIDHSGAGGYTVLIVSDKDVLEQRRIEIGQVADGLVEVTAGLKPGDRVARDPARLQAGQPVKPQTAPDRANKNGDLGVGLPPERPVPELPGTGPALVVQAKYPGANAAVVAEVVSAPIDQQINGLEKLTHRVLACGNDGTMRLTLLFETGTDLNKAQVLAQNRVAMALPQLPDEVRRLGPSVKKRGVFLAAVAVRSPTDQYDRIFLANYAKARLGDELARVPGVADVTFYGDTEPGKQVRLLIDREKLARMGLTVSGLADALRDQGLTASIMGGHNPSLSLAGHLPDPDQLGRMEVANDKGQKVPIGNVARIELATGWGTATALDGKPCVLLLVSRLTDADVKATSKVLRDQMAELAKQAPEGVELKVIGEP